MSQRHQLSEADSRFAADFEAFQISPEAFDHRAHLRLAYVYLVEGSQDAATARMRDSLLGFLRHLQIDPAKYHETITRAWILAVRHFMERTPESDCADSFIDANPIMLDSEIMLTHYSAELLFSEEARRRFAEPDLDPIPRHGDGRRAR